MISGGSTFARPHQRLVAVEFLLEKELYFEAVYLGGYVIECSLKAVILGRVPPRDRVAYATRYFRGAAAHNFHALRMRLAEHGAEVPGDLLREMSKYRWSTDLRYEVGVFHRAEARQFIAVAERVLR